MTVQSSLPRELLDRIFRCASICAELSRIEVYIRGPKPKPGGEKGGNYRQPTNYDLKAGRRHANSCGQCGNPATSKWSFA
jgi:hypothetical protein